MLLRTSNVPVCGASVGVSPRVLPGILLPGPQPRSLLATLGRVACLPSSVPSTCGGSPRLPQALLTSPLGLWKLSQCHRPRGTRDSLGLQPPGQALGTCLLSLHVLLTLLRGFGAPRPPAPWAAVVPALFHGQGDGAGWAGSVRGRPGMRWLTCPHPAGPFLLLSDRRGSWWEMTGHPCGRRGCTVGQAVRGWPGAAEAGRPGPALLPSGAGPGPSGVLGGGPGRGRPSPRPRAAPSRAPSFSPPAGDGARQRCPLDFFLLPN